MNHCFNLGIANEFDLNIATFLQSIAFWTHNNLTNKRNLIDGHCWTYNTLQALGETFTYWSKKQLEIVINNAVKSGLLLKDNHNKNKYDRTCWYALSPMAYRFFPELCQEHFFERMFESLPETNNTLFPEWRNHFPQTGTPIPITNSDTKNNNTNSESCDSPAAAVKEVKKKQPSVELRELIDVYRKEFPNNPQPHARVIATSLQKTLQTLIKRWPELDPNGKPLTAELFQRYLSLLRTTAPNFSLKEFTTESGNRKKNDLETFARWNTVVRFLENKYS